MASLLESTYIIDGMSKELTPAELLGTGGSRDASAEPIVDESCDPGLGAVDFHSSCVDSYISAVAEARRTFPKSFADSYTKLRISAALLDSIWHGGHFRICDLALRLDWKVREAEVGNMAAFYSSVEAAADFADALGLQISKAAATRSQQTQLRAEAVVCASEDDDDVLVDRPFQTRKPVLRKSVIPSVLDPDPSSWIVYVPFDTSDYRLGGSLLCEAMSTPSGIAPQLGDADYFIDCYEVVRELVEDGVIVAGTTVADGGLVTALKRMTAGGTGAAADLSDLSRSSGESRIVNMLFSEVPGALFQIRDSDFDYVDAELLLQDVAFYPLGHPCVENSSLRIKSSARTGIQKILESLVQKQSAEGED